MRRRGWISGPARNESTDRFHAIDSRPVWWTGPEAGDWLPASAVDRDCASGLVSSLVISIVVRRSTRWGHTGGQSGFGRFLGPAESGDRATASVMSSSPLAIMSVTIDVSIVPGQTALIRIPRGAYTNAALAVSPDHPVLRGMVRSRACHDERRRQTPLVAAA